MSPGSPPRWSADDLASIVSRLGSEISADHPHGVIIVGVLKGSLCLVADLVRRLEVPCAVDFLALSPYVAGAARVRILKDIDLDVTGLDVVLVEDIVDTGLSSRYVMDLLESRGARRVALCALLDRPGRRFLPVRVDYLGDIAPEDFLVGYGLDYAERYRNLPGIHPVRPDDLDVGVVAFENELYG